MKEQRLTGTIKYWNARKGFGFIEPEDKEKQIFVHIKAFKERKGKPNIGDAVSYLLSEDETGRARADEVMAASETELKQTAGTRKNPVYKIAVIAVVLAVVVVTIAKLV